MILHRQKMFFKMPAGLTKEAENSIRRARKDAAEKLSAYRNAKMYDKAVGSNSRWMYQTPEQVKSTLKYEVEAATKKSVRQRAKNIARIRAQRQPSLMEKVKGGVKKAVETVKASTPKFQPKLQPALALVRR